MSTTQETPTPIQAITATPTIEVTPTPTPPEIILSEPFSGSAIQSPVMIKGTAPKGWTFEAAITIIVEDAQRKKISGGSFPTKEIEGSDNLVSFSISIPYSTKMTAGFVTVKNDNPSGLPENEKSFSIPVTFGTSASITPKYTCPTTEWVDCMPGPGTVKPQCTQDFLSWATANCPGFKGAAL